MKKYIYTSIKVDLIDHKHTKSKVSCVCRCPQQKNSDESLGHKLNVYFDEMMKHILQWIEIVKLNG